jgi:hypothetical protein
MYWMGQRHGPLHPVAKLVTYRNWLTATHGGLKVTTKSDAAPIRLELKWGPLATEVKNHGGHIVVLADYVCEIMHRRKDTR